MMGSLSLLVTCLSGLVALANPVARDGMVVLQSIESAPTSFEYVGPASPSATVSLRLQLVQGNMTGLEQELYAVSTPGSERYGQYLTKEQVEAHVRPAPETTSLVSDWISKEKISVASTSPAGDWYKFSLPVSKANELFDTEFGLYKDTGSGMQVVRTLQYSVPATLQGHVTFLHPTISFPVIPQDKSEVMKKSAVQNTSNAKRSGITRRQSVPMSCGNELTPVCLLDFYNISKTPATEKSNMLGVMGLNDEFANFQDLEAFLHTYRPDVPSNTTFTVQSIAGGTNSQDPSLAGGEASLDIQWTVGMATNVPVIFLTVGGGLGGLELSDVLLAEDAPPQVISASYGGNENINDPAGTTTECNAYMQLSARGVSILYASGDGGVAGFGTDDCTVFRPTFPSTCPYVTSVGATIALPEDPAFFSSGGFSNFFPRPSYQSTAVSNYLDILGSQDAGLFNTTGRAFPDVSAAGFFIDIVVDNTDQITAGTSASTPIFASVIALINDQLIANGKTVMGFLNPFLYSTGFTGLNDITAPQGNPGCGTDGFPSAVGWDPITGLGSPNFPAFKQAAFAAKGL